MTACKWSDQPLFCRPNSPQVSSVDSPASLAALADIDLPTDPGHVSKDGLPLVDADTFAKLLSEVSTHCLPFFEAKTYPSAEQPKGVVSSEGSMQYPAGRTVLRRVSCARW